MSWQDPDREDTTIYKVVVNNEEQYSIWPRAQGDPYWLEGRRQGRAKSRVPGLHQRGVD
jgi:uncharacterized protein YbdZ (MbtH family)